VFLLLHIFKYKSHTHTHLIS